MNEVKWTDDLSVGVELIDSQHKQWIEHLNGLARAVEEHKGGTKVAETLDFLIDYTQLHFSTEEKHMAASNYEGFGEHKVRHEEFRTTLSDLERDFREEGATHILADAIDTLLANWLIKHVTGVDQEFGRFVKENGVTISDD